MLTILLLATIALLCQCKAHSLDYVEAQYQKPVPQRISKFINAAYNPLVKEQQLSSSHSISIEPLNTDDAVFCSYTSPDTGRVIFSLVQKETDDLVLNIGVRYTFGSEKNVLVLNSRKNGVWGEEIRPSGFDFSPNIQVNLVVSVGDAGFDIFTIDNNGVAQYIATFPYRPGLPVSLVNLIRIVSDGNSGVDNVGLGVFFANQ